MQIVSESTKTSDCSLPLQAQRRASTTRSTRLKTRSPVQTAISMPSRRHTLMPRRESSKQKQHGSVDRGDVIVYELMGASAILPSHVTTRRGFVRGGVLTECAQRRLEREPWRSGVPIILPGWRVTRVGPRHDPQYTRAHFGGEAVALQPRQPSTWSRSELVQRSQVCSQDAQRVRRRCCQPTWRQQEDLVEGPTRQCRRFCRPWRSRKSSSWSPSVGCTTRCPRVRKCWRFAGVPQVQLIDKVADVSV